jgi:MFS family permease
LPPRLARQLGQARLAILAFFGVLGVTNGDWLARIPALTHGLHLSHGLLGLALLAAPAGSFAVASPAGLLVDRIGSRAPTAVAGLAVALLPISFGLAPSQAALMAGMFSFGVVAGALDVSMNAQAVQLQSAVGRQLMTSFHACYSFGALAGGLIGGAFAWRQVGPVPDFTAVAVPLAVVALAAGRFLLGPAHVEPSGAGFPAGSAGPSGPAREAGSDGRTMLADSRSRRGARISPLLVLGLLALCSLLGEGAADGWSAVYLRDNLGTSAGFAAMGYAAFALTMAAGRLVGDRLADRFGPAALLRGGGLLAAAGMALVLVTGTPAGALIGLAGYGAGLSCTFPQVLAVAGSIAADRPGVAIGRVAGTGYVGMLAGPVLIGGLATAAGLTTALGFPTLLALGIAVGARQAVPRGSYRRRR